MSIIIRLQNLPWNANAADIRQFFQNLTIPDGGVHIVGGENGDAFIAFGSDEDARQAMLLDGGKIKDSKIKLLLSSRTEMQKVIELAKQQAITLQNLMQSMAAASTFGTTPLSMLPNMLSGISGLPNLPQLPVTGSNTVTPAITAIPAPPTSHELKEVKAAQMENKTVASKDGKSKESDKTRSSSRSVSRSRSRSRSRDRRYRDRYRYRNRSRDRKWHRDRSRSKDRDRKNSRSRSRDRYKRRSRSRDKRSRDRDHKAKDKRAKTHDKKEKSPIVIKDGKPSQTKTTVDMKSKPLFGGKKNEVTSVDAIPLLGDDISSPKLSDCFNVDSKSFPLANKPKPITPQIQIKLNSNGSPKTEPKTETDSKTSWMNSVPMPPMISSWMLSQTNDKPIKEEENKDDKNKLANATNGDEKVDTAAPIPFGMFAPQFPFGPGFPPPPPAMYPFAAGYPNPAAPQFMGADQAMPAMQVPAFFNPYQTASPVLPGTPTQPNTSPSTMKNNIEPPDKLPRMENDEDVKTDQRNNYDNHDYDYSRKYSKPNNYYSEGYNDKNYSTGGGFKRDDYKSDREYDSYDKPHGYPNRNSENDEEPYRKPYSRRNFMDENYDRRDTYEHGDSRKYAPSFTLSYPGSVCAEVVNLPRDANVIDIKKFFSPLPLYESSIKFQSDGKGNKTRNAYVKFLNINHKLQALKYSGKIIRGYRVTVSDMDPTVYEAAEDYTIAAVEQQFLKVSFIPKRARRQDVLNAFPNAPDDMIVMKDRNKDSLVAYIKFASSAMVKSALADKHKILISNSRVKLEPITEEEYLIARADYQISEDSLDNDDDINENTVVENVKTDKISKPSTNARWNEVNSESNDETSNDRKYEVEEYEPQNKVFKSNCILMKNLPLNITDREIVDFFADINVVPSQIHIMFDNDYKQTGDTFCEFSDEHQAFEALSKNNLTLNDKRVTITIVPREDVLRAIGAPLPEKHFPNSRFNLPPIPKKSYPPPVRPRMPFGGPGPRHMPPRGPPAMPVRRPPGPEHFGKPGCVVGLENIPYKADVDEILEFFGHFDVQRENIIRRFNENGQATGDARVCLKNPIEAQKAIQQLDGKRIRDRVIFVNLVK